MGDKRAALRDLAQHLGLFTDKVQHTHEHTILVEHAAAELTQKIALLTSRAREPAAMVADDGGRRARAAGRLSKMRTSTHLRVLLSLLEDDDEAGE
jgi:hypothetical protein